MQKQSKTIENNWDMYCYMPFLQLLNIKRWVGTLAYFLVSLIAVFCFFVKENRCRTMDYYRIGQVFVRDNRQQTGAVPIWHLCVLQFSTCSQPVLNLFSTCSCVVYCWQRDRLAFTCESRAATRLPLATTTVQIYTLLLFWSWRSKAPLN